MVVSAAIGRADVVVHGTEAVIAQSLLVLGAVVVLAWRPPVVTSAVIIGGFAMFHGHGHGTEGPAGASPALDAAGFVVAAALLLGMGLGMELQGALVGLGDGAAVHGRGRGGA